MKGALHVLDGSHLHFLKRLLPVMVALFIFPGLMACQRELTPETSCQFLQNPDKQRVSWKTNLPVPLYIHNSVPRQAYEAIEAAIAVYDQVLGHQAFEIRGYGTTGSLSPARDGYSVIYWMPDWEPERLQEQGRTTVYWSGHTIYEADVRINASQASNLTFHFNPETPVRGVDLKSLFVHELGHVLGLDHNDHVADSIMRTHLGEGRSRTVLSAADISNLSCEYPPGG